MAKWDWDPLRGSVERLENTDDGEGTMLDNTLVPAVSHFGLHHSMQRIPVALFGNAQGQLQTGRYVQLASPQHNDKVLTSVAPPRAKPSEPGAGRSPHDTTATRDEGRCPKATRQP